MKNAQLQERAPSAPRDTVLWRVSDLLLDTRRQRVFRGSAEIPLPKLTYDLFVALVRRDPEVVADEELMKEVWPKLVVSPETMSQRVKLLRAALGDDSKTPRYIGRLRGRGYHLVHRAEALFEEEGLIPSRAATPPHLTLLELEDESSEISRPDWAITQVLDEDMAVKVEPQSPPATAVSAAPELSAAVTPLVATAAPTWPDRVQQWWRPVVSVVLLLAAISLIYIFHCIAAAT